MSRLLPRVLLALVLATLALALAGRGGEPALRDLGQAASVALWLRPIVPIQGASPGRNAARNAEPT